MAQQGKGSKIFHNSNKQKRKKKKIKDDRDFGKGKFMISGNVAESAESESDHPPICLGKKKTNKKKKQENIECIFSVFYFYYNHFAYMCLVSRSISFAALQVIGALMVH